jgi:collagenase-like PrtC family protease
VDWTGVAHVFVGRSQEYCKRRMNFFKHSGSLAEGLQYSSKAHQEVTRVLNELSRLKALE